MLIFEGKKNMNVVIKEKRARSILSKSGIPGIDYCLNPYTGCSHGCKYCYATFMKRFTGHLETWGSFVDAKINAPQVLQRQLKNAARGNVMISSVTDPYQPTESQFKITRRCLEVLLAYQFPVRILTKASLVLRDLDLIRKFDEMEVGITITTDDDKIRQIFEPNAPSIETRVQALKELSENGIKTYAFIGPLLPLNPEALAEKIRPYIQSVLIDRMNYPSKTRKIYEAGKLDPWLNYDFVDEIIERLEIGFAGKEVSRC
jgi:DNA repair photolyase